MTFLPIVDRELRVAARRPATYWTRLVFAIAGAGIVSLALLFAAAAQTGATGIGGWLRSEEHTSELQSQSNLVCRLLLEKKTKTNRLGTLTTESIIMH